MEIAFKIGVPSHDELQLWGDYHLAKAMAEELAKYGHTCEIHILPEWKDPNDSKRDIIIHLKGLSRYRPRGGPINVMWLISHPEKISIRELNRYDAILVASKKFALELKKKVKTPVYTLLQFASTRVMYPDPDPDHSCELLFLGNSRNVYRPIVRDLLPTQFDLHVWGSRWEGLIPRRYIRGRYFPYEKARRLYSSASIVLNDHWDSMRKYGFINNRVFDALACKAFVLSDYCTDMDALFSGCLVSYEGRQDLHDKIETYINCPEKREDIARKGYMRVVSEHTVAHRVEELMEIFWRF